MSQTLRGRGALPQNGPSCDNFTREIDTFRRASRGAHCTVVFLDEAWGWSSVKFEIDVIHCRCEIVRFDGEMNGKPAYLQRFAFL